MSRDGKSESPKSGKNLDLNDVEMVFGTPSSPKSAGGPDVHVHVTNETRRGSDDRKKPNQASESDVEAIQPTQPLLEPDRDRQKPPLAGPEIDDLEDSKPSSPHANTPAYPGIDDGLLDNGGQRPVDHGHDVTPSSEGKEGSNHSHHDDGNTEDGKWHELTILHGKGNGNDETDFYYGEGYIANGIQNRLGEADDRPGSPGMIPVIIPDVNTYQQKKNLAQGMMDLALLSANANQLRYVLESSATHPYYYPSLVFITCSIILQIAVGVGLIMNSRYNVKDEKDICKADKINNMTILGIFLITIVNVFITSFSVATPATLTAQAQLNG